MIKVLCETQNTLLLKDLVSFQGNLKKRTPGDIKDLSNSLVNEGMIMPFVVWQQDDSNKLLDGHGRLQALSLLSEVDSTINEQQFPVLFIKAENEDDARKLLLQITSSYGHINKKGAIEFCSSISGYRAPAINKYVHHKQVKRKEVNKNTQIIKISVPVEMAKNVIDLLKQVDYIQVL